MEQVKNKITEDYDSWYFCPLCMIVQNPKYQKIQDMFSKIEKTFTEKSEPVYLNELGDQLSLKKIHEIESVDGEPITLIAVTRIQYDVSSFPEYEKYIKNTLNLSRIYYGLWPNSKIKKIEYDVLYAIPTDDYEEIQKHLNAHNDMNQGNPQKMALIINSNGEWETRDNLQLK